MWAGGTLYWQSEPWGQALGQTQCDVESVQQELSIELSREVKPWRAFSQACKDYYFNLRSTSIK